MSRLIDARRLESENIDRGQIFVGFLKRTFVDETDDALLGRNAEVVVALLADPEVLSQLDLVDDDELREDADPEEPPDAVAVGGDQVRPQQELARAEAHAERDDGRADEVSEPGDPGDFVIDAIRRPVAARRKRGGVRGLGKLALGEGTVNTFAVSPALVVAGGDLRRGTFRRAEGRGHRTAPS